MRKGVEASAAIDPFLLATPWCRTYTARLGNAAGQKGLPSGVVDPSRQQEVEMPKMKTKSSAKKRFKMTANGKVRSSQAGKRHGMIKRTRKFIRNARGTTVLGRAASRIVKSYMPYSR